MGCRPGSRDVGYKLPWEPQGLARNQFCRRGPQAQHDPREPVNPAAVLEPGLKRGLHGAMKPAHNPLACGWYAVVRWSVMPRLSAAAFQSSDVNCEPRSEEWSDGVLNRATVAMNAQAASVDVADDSRTASGQRMVLSTFVR